MTAKLSNQFLKLVNENKVNEKQSKLKFPKYNRNELQQSIMHFGVGAFHRAHFASYIDKLNNLNYEINQVKNVDDRPEPYYGIIGVGLRPPYDKLMSDVLSAQDNLYLLISRDENIMKGRVIGSIAKYIFAPENYELVFDHLLSPSLSIVSMTITEGGYLIDSNGRFDDNNEDIKHDLVNKSKPKTVFGYIVESLRLRRKNGIKAFTVLSCDNLQGNGEIAKKAVLSFARLVESTYDLHRRNNGDDGDDDKESIIGLADWIQSNVTFPNCMVDRITPQTTNDDKLLIHECFEVEDGWPVVTEPFKQWVIEDHFCSERPKWEKVGVQMTSNVIPFELMKLRLLNASHSSIAYLGYMAGYRLVHDVMNSPDFLSFISQIMSNEVQQLLPEIEGVDLHVYQKSLIQRFKNPTIRDQVARLCLDGSAKFPKFILPSISEYHARHSALPRYLCFAVASWVQYLRGTDESGASYPLIDPMADQLKSILQSETDFVDSILSLDAIFGDLSTNSEFKNLVRSFVVSINELGASPSLSLLLSSN